MSRKKNTPSQKSEQPFNEDKVRKISMFHDWDATLQSLLELGDKTSKGELLFSTIEKLYEFTKEYPILTDTIPKNLTSKEFAQEKSLRDLGWALGYYVHKKFNTTHPAFDYDDPVKNHDYYTISTCGVWWRDQGIKSDLPQWVKDTNDAVKGSIWSKTGMGEDNEKYIAKIKNDLDSSVESLLKKLDINTKRETNTLPVLINKMLSQKSNDSVNQEKTQKPIKKIKKGSWRPFFSTLFAKLRKKK